MAWAELHRTENEPCQDTEPKVQNVVNFLIAFRAFEHLLKRISPTDTPITHDSRNSSSIISISKQTLLDSINSIPQEPYDGTTILYDLHRKPRLVISPSEDSQIVLPSTDSAPEEPENGTNNAWIMQSFWTILRTYLGERGIRIQTSYENTLTLLDPDYTNRQGATELPSPRSIKSVEEAIRDLLIISRALTNNENFPTVTDTDSDSDLVKSIIQQLKQENFDFHSGYDLLRNILGTIIMTLQVSIYDFKES